MLGSIFKLLSAHRICSLLTALILVLFSASVVQAMPINPDQIEDRLQDGQLCDFINCFHDPVFPYSSISPITLLPSTLPTSPSIYNFFQARFPLSAGTVFGNSVLDLNFIHSSVDPNLPSGSSIEYSFDQGATWQDNLTPQIPTPTHLMVRFRFFGSPLATQSGVTGVFNSLQFDPSPTPISTDKTPPFIFFFNPHFPVIVFDKSPILSVSFYYRLSKRSPWTLINTDTKPPYLLIWGRNKKPKSDYQLQARAIDLFDNTGTSNILTIHSRYEIRN